MAGEHEEIEEDVRRMCKEYEQGELSLWTNQCSIGCKKTLRNSETKKLDLYKDRFCTDSGMGHELYASLIPALGQPDC